MSPSYDLLAVRAHNHTDMNRPHLPTATITRAHTVSLRLAMIILWMALVLEPLLLLDSLADWLKGHSSLEHNMLSGIGMVLFYPYWLGMMRECRHELQRRGALSGNHGAM